MHNKIANINSAMFSFSLQIQMSFINSTIEVIRNLFQSKYSAPIDIEIWFIVGNN